MCQTWCCLTGPPWGDSKRCFQWWSKIQGMDHCSSIQAAFAFAVSSCFVIWFWVLKRQGVPVTFSHLFRVQMNTLYFSTPQPSWNSFSKNIRMIFPDMWAVFALKDRHSNHSAFSSSMLACGECQELSWCSLGKETSKPPGTTSLWAQGTLSNNFSFSQRTGFPSQISQVSYSGPHIPPLWKYLALSLTHLLGQDQIQCSRHRIWRQGARVHGEDEARSWAEGEAGRGASKGEAEKGRGEGEAASWRKKQKRRRGWKLKRSLGKKKRKGWRKKQRRRWGWKPKRSWRKQKRRGRRNKQRRTGASWKHMQLQR